METYAEFYTGVKIVRGIPHPDFKNVGDKVIYNYPLVLMSQKPIQEVREIVPALELASRARKQLFIISPLISDSVLSTLIYNKRKNIVEACGVTLTEYGKKHLEYLEKTA